MWKRFKKFILNLVHLFSFKKNIDSNKNDTINPDVLSANGNKGESSELQNVVLEVKNIENDEFVDALSEEEWKEQYGTLSKKGKKTYEQNKFYSANSLQEVTKFTNHKNTFAAAIFEYSVDEQSKNNNDGYQLTGLELKTDKESKACTLNFQGKQSTIKINSDHLRLYMPFFFEDKKQKSIDELFQYEKDDITSTPSVVILLEKPDSINLNPNFGWNFIYNKAWGMIKNSETEKSSKIPKALFPTFAVELAEQNINFSINKSAIPKSIEDLKDEKPIIGERLAIPYMSSLAEMAIGDIIDKITNEAKKTSFCIKDVLICGKIINELQVQNSIAKEDEHRDLIQEDEFFDALEVQENEQDMKQKGRSELSEVTISHEVSAGTGLKV